MRKIVALAALLAFSMPFAHADTRAHMDEELARYSKYAMEPVDHFDMFDIWQWQVVGPQKLLIWSTIKDLYIVTVDKGCNRLEWARGISVTQHMQWKVTTTFDFVDFGNQHCKIVQIQPIDYKTMRATEGEKR